MSTARVVALALVGIVVAIVAGVSVGRTLTPDSAAPPAPVAALRPSAPDPALRPVLGRLDRARLTGRSALQRAHTPADQAAAARRLAAAHRRASAQLDAPLSSRLTATARAYGVLASAARAESPARYRGARRAVDAAEAALARAVDAARRPRAAGPPTHASASRPDPGSAPVLLVLLGIAATAVIGLFVGTAIAPRPTAHG